MQHLKGLFKVLTKKILFIEWILQILKSITFYFFKLLSRIEANEFIEGKEELDLRDANKSVKAQIIYDEKVLKEEIKKEVKKEIDEEFENVYHLFIFQARQIENNSNFHHQVKTIIRNLHGEGSLSLIKKENGDKEK